ncbi:MULTISPECIES: YbaN family protein [Sphingomonadales]|jgi:uncharacterized membrane protein YbaN (DUF454 family)|uniref:DUF454 domain-containing protein n=2 Tax=Sphingomonadaceae TaxID=41297 RepID=A0A397PC50_9SPHN|nr:MULTISPECIES: YbaN family protein [Sphingomonadaceae]EKU73369.1 hypothetical protein HMPREF9718_03838 [Sphingobium yanoikuyae ATCC 51230]RIA46003.1 hypothetical protein DFR49_0532 [Hephaestia caeni]WQE08152.1 YbaN family protein [Sphingobium yanoikuyae]
MRAAPDILKKRGPGSRFIRTGWLFLGLLCVGLGLIGAFVPLLPTTIFMILAAGCFARSSPRLETWLLDHPRFGPTLLAWRAERAIPRAGKRAACIGIAIGYALFWIGAKPALGLGVTVAAVMAACVAWIVTRPAPESR